jgi:hypothetical protein
VSSPVGNIPTNELLDAHSVMGQDKAPLWMTFQNARFTTGWQKFMSDVSNYLIALTSSGTTADRPTKMLFTGKTYFDTTIGKPIWYNGTSWVKADGTAA